MPLSMTDSDLSKLIRRKLSQRPVDAQAWQDAIVELQELAAEIRRRLPAEYAGHPLDSQ